MTLQWFRVDSHIASHDKILTLLADETATPANRWRAAFSYVCAIGWSADQGTDGLIPRHALPFVHGTTSTANLLVHHRLWEPALTGWTIHNYAVRQQLAHVSDAKRDAARIASEKGNCVRWHGPDCWGPKGCSRA